MGDGLPRGLDLYWLTLLRAESERPSPLNAEVVGRAGLAHPKADLERPAAEPGGGILAALQFKGADQPGRAPELIEGQQPQGVAHDDADPGPGDVRRRLGCGAAEGPW